MVITIVEWCLHSQLAGKPYLLFCEALFFAIIAYFIGLRYDKFTYHHKRAEKEKHYRLLIEQSPEAILVHQNNRIVFANEKLRSLLQAESDQLIGKSIFEFILPAYHEQIKEKIANAMRKEGEFDLIELKIHDKNKAIRHVEIASGPIIYNHVPSIQVIIRDITERRELEDSLKQSQEMHQFIAENTTDIVSYLNPDGTYHFISPSCKQLLGYKPIEVTGKRVAQILHPEESYKILELIVSAHSNLDSAAFSHRLRRKDGTYLWFETTARALRTPEKELDGIVAVSRDITAWLEKERTLKESNEKLRHLLNIDGLTGIANRRYFDERLVEEWNRMKQQAAPLSVLMIDIDFFKNFNDYYGHQAGDACIQQIATALQDTVKRNSDVVARYGGEEFVVLLPETDIDGAAFVGELLVENVRALELLNAVSTVSKFVTVSVGCSSVIPSDERESTELIELADKGLYAAKDAGKNQVVLFESD